ncbi:MAG TPA: hypothetical protein VFW19_16445 [Allosphingosinicella sp.]|nr:hypothetical protein [Allosphingosinicella sp.]
MKIGLFVDRMEVARWQAAALEGLGEDVALVVYNCRNTRPGRRRLANALYYLLNLFTIRNPMTRPVPLDHSRFAHVECHDFDSHHEGAWQRLPEPLLEQISRDAPDVLLKFGLSLLRVPDRTVLAPPILSYHHGDPRHFRGRPAGFYEMLRGAPVLGQIVQILSNRLDGGAVVAFAETKVHAHSYRRTLVEAYRHSPLILGAAIRNALAGKSLDIAPTGRAYRLPANFTVARFVARALVRTVSRFCYGLFVHKKWAVATCPARPGDLIGTEDRDRLGDRSRWQVEPTPPGYVFLADPFFRPAGDGLLVEALSARTGGGELLSLSQNGAAKLSRPGCHMSYPAAFQWAGETYVMPEMCEWSDACLYRLEGSDLALAGALDFGGPRRIIDPTPFARGAHLYLFGNDASDGDAALRLWVADVPAGPYSEHPASPILISPRGGRMAGGLAQAGTRLFRLGQDGSSDYGDGIIVFEVEELTPDSYRERAVGELRFRGLRGPHTLNFGGGRAAFDFYSDRLSPMAGFRRLQARRARR